tara:strand:- start:1982 stop:2335 length:354 start_codon:yes stop_codon:yes gene_type:complete
MRYKVVINNAYGGFDLSEKAIAMIAEKKGISVEKAEKLGRDWSCIGWGGLDEGMLPRHDPDLVSTVETLRIDASESGDEDIIVVEISTNRYRITEYDGAEGVQTPDSMDWTVIEEAT